jgi:NADH-quinone oxidoreductase subunit M
VGTTDIEVLLAHPFARDLQIWLWLAFFASFAVKMPMWPVHTWLPDAHVQAPTAGSVILAGILLKLGGYGFLRFSIPMFPNASEFFAPMVFILSIIAIVVTSLIAFRQTDIKKLIAYSSVAHMGFVTLGIFTMTELGVQGAIFQMLSHGVISAALFLCIGVIYDRFHTREISFYGGLVHKMPVYAAVFGLFAMANVGLPGTSGFIGEIMTMTGAFKVDPRVAAGAALGVIFSAVYMLTAYKKVVFGVITNPKLEAATDLNVREWINLGVLAVLAVYFGFFSTPITDTTRASVDQLIQHYQSAQTVEAPVAEAAPAETAAH